jgi:ribonuclease HI
MKSKKILDIFMKIYCDGSCLGNPGPGGWAAVFVKEGHVIKKICGFEQHTTNNKMELTAAIKALENITKNSDLQIFTDSNYLKFGITEWIKSWKLNNWKNGKIKNIEFWQQLDKLNLTQKASWHWVKAHNGDKYNEMADELARNAASDKITLV